MIAVRDWPPYRPPVPTINTQTYHQVLQEADTMGGWYGPDGAVDQQELQQYKQQLDQQAQWINYLKSWFGNSGYFGDYLNNWEKSLKEKQNAVNVMQQNYGQFAGAGNDAPWSISHNDIQSIAQRDGNGNNITADDVYGRIVPPPPPPVKPETAAVNLLQGNFDKIDANKDGVLTDAEIRTYRLQNRNVEAQHGKALDDLQEDSHELMFASIDPGNAAWHGLTKQDLAVIKDRLAKGETLEQIADERRQTIARERGVAADEVGFESYVDRMRRQIPLPTNADRVAQLRSQFTQLDKNNNGVLEAGELNAAGDQIGKDLAALNRELMFASIDPGNAAWHGLTRQDMDKLAQRLRNGETLQSIAQQLRTQIGRERGVSSAVDAFRAWVDQQRQRIPNR